MSDKDALDVVMDWLAITKANERALVPAVGLGPEDFACAERIRAAHPPDVPFRIGGPMVTWYAIDSFAWPDAEGERGRRRRLRRARRARINRRGWA